MKKNILSIIILAAIFTTASAQDNIYGGLRLSPNYTIFNNEVKVGNKTVNSGVGYGIGYYEVLEISNKINIQAELNYNTLSFKHDITDGSISYRYTNLDFPLMVKYRVSEQFAIGAGYQFNLLNSVVGSGTQITKVKSTKTNVEVDGVKNQGFFVDANIKSGNNVFGLRILSTKFTQGAGLDNLNFFDPTDDFDTPSLGGSPIVDERAINISLYVGFTLFK
jgi:hypothetical protein